MSSAATNLRGWGNKMRIIDISMEIYEGMMCYPRNPPFVSSPALVLKKDGSNVSHISMGTHTGTHIDTLKHVNDGGWTTSDLSADATVGKAVVIAFTEKERSKISKDDLLKFSEEIGKHKVVLFKTYNSYRDNSVFYDDFVALTEDAAEFLASTGIKAVGIDALSIKKRGIHDKTHDFLLEKGIVIFEGLNMREAEEGSYLFVGLPLKLRGLDGAPARAILIKDE